MSLLELSIQTVRLHPDYPAGQPSYNVIVTREHMYMVPRRHAEHGLRESGEGLSVNSMAFAGKLLVKSEEELKAVKQESVLAILRDVGVGSVHDEQIVGEHETDR